MGGRHPWQPTDEQRRQVEAMAAYGIPHQDIANVLGIARNTLTKHFRYELDTAHTRATTQVASKLYAKAMEGDTACMMFWLKTRAHWRETNRHEVTGADGGPIQTAHSVDLSQLSTDEIRKLRDYAQRIAPGDGEDPDESGDPGQGAG